ncbi:hypothetical protein BCh11DRAFT_04501 [Burkholderia sp. Ch1-1]|nr:hypothetical protein BCh11DRAFT_04501 [Burkholderia sp. Ch1-1]
MEMEVDDGVTLREAAFIFNSPFKDVVRLIDEHAGMARIYRRQPGSVRQLSFADLIYLQAVFDMGELLTPKGRWELHQTLLEAQALNKEKEEVQLGRFVFPLHRVEADVHRRLDELNRLKAGVEGNPDDPFIKGTHVEVYRVAALLEGGSSPRDVRADYPSLTTDQTEFAGTYSKAIPKKGRPYPKKSFRRSLEGLDLDSLGLGDEATDE